MTSCVADLCGRLQRRVEDMGQQRVLAAGDARAGALVDFEQVRHPDKNTKVGPAYRSFSYDTIGRQRGRQRSGRDCWVSGRAPMGYIIHECYR